MAPQDLVLTYRGYHIYYSRIDGYYHTDRSPFESLADAKKHIEVITLPEDMEPYQLDYETISLNTN